MDNTSGSANTAASDLDNKIKSKFKLFQGVRPEEEDQKIYDKVMDLCFDEITLFVSESLKENEREELKKEMEAKENEEDKANSMLSYITKIEDYKVRLGGRIDYFLDNLLYTSVSSLDLKSNNLNK